LPVGLLLTPARKIFLKKYEEFRKDIDVVKKGGYIDLKEVCYYYERILSLPELRN
jgi:hypothetical protein